MIRAKLESTNLGSSKMHGSWLAPWIIPSCRGSWYCSWKFSVLVKCLRRIFQIIFSTRTLFEAMYNKRWTLVCGHSKCLLWRFGYAKCPKLWLNWNPCTLWQTKYSNIISALCPTTTDHDGAKSANPSKKILGIQKDITRMGTLKSETVIPCSRSFLKVSTTLDSRVASLKEWKVAWSTPLVWRPSSLCMGHWTVERSSVETVRFW